MIEKELVLYTIDCEIKYLEMEYENLRFVYDEMEAKQLDKAISKLKQLYIIFESFN